MKRPAVVAEFECATYTSGTRTAALSNAFATSCSVLRLQASLRREGSVQGQSSPLLRRMRGSCKVWV